MKWINILFVFLVFGCDQQSNKLSTNEIAKIENDIIMRSECKLPTFRTELN